MSDDGLINVEDDTPAQPAEADPQSLVGGDGLASDDPAVPPVASADHPAEVDAVEVGGQKYVPVGALISERKQRQAAEKEAAKVSELEAYARDSKPYVEFLKANPGLINQ